MHRSGRIAGTRKAIVHSNYILLDVPYGAELEEMEIVDLTTMDVISVDRSPEAAKTLLRENPNRDLRQD